MNFFYGGGGGRAARRQRIGTPPNAADGVMADGSGGNL